MSNVAEGKLEHYYMKRQRRNIVLLFDDTPIDWSWDEDELRLLVDLYNFGNSIEEINRVFEREDPDEIFLALFYLAKKGEIKKLDLFQLKGC
jgi:hypothetical protein